MRLTPGTIAYGTIMTTIEKSAQSLQRLEDNLALVIRGKQRQIRILIAGLLADGSILMEDVPGVGKTTLAAALARSIDCNFNRIQFTPDLLPADVTGSSIYNPVTGNFDFRPGPVFCNILLADEINRASPRTQSALLEAMNETQVSVEGDQLPLPEPFMVLATQNPIDFHGTFPLPESQLDRFLLRVTLGYPDQETESQLVHTRSAYEPLDEIEPVMSAADVCILQARTTEVKIEPCVSKYIVDVVTATRNHPDVRFGASTRGSLMLGRVSQAWAFLQTRAYVTPDDVQLMAPLTLPHRLILNSNSIYAGLDAGNIVADILADIKVPI